MSNFNIWKSYTVLIIVFVATSSTEVITLRLAEVLVTESTGINCRSKEVKSIQWHHTPPGKNSSEYVYAGGRFYFPYNTGRFGADDDWDSNVHTLTITNVMHEDAGLYECKDDVLSRVFGSTHLTVLDSSPSCTSNMNPNGFSGPNTCNIEQENMTFSCAVSFSGNAPNLKWSTLNGNQASNSSICERKDNRINCSLSMKADPSFDGSTFTCQTTTSNDARYKCSIKDTRVEYFFGDYQTAKKRVSDNITCVVASNLHIRYNWTMQQNNQDYIFSANRTIYLEKPGIYQCSVKYNIRNVTCNATIVTVNVSNIVDYQEPVAESSNVSREQSNAPAILVSSVVSVVSTAVIGLLVFFKWRKGNETKPKAEVAYTYFFGFLQIVIPDFWNSFVKEIQRPSAIKEPTEKTFLVKKMLIIIPETLLCPTRLTEDTNIRRAGLSIKKYSDRAGKENRDYPIPIYELTDKKSGNVYYFAIDIPSCLKGIRQAYDNKLNSMSIYDVSKARKDFVLSLTALLNEPKYRSQFENQWELLLWPGDKENKRMELSEFVCKEIRNKKLAVKLADVLKQPIE